MAVGFPVKDDYATGDVLTAANMNDLAGTLNTVPDTIGAYAAGKNKIINGDFRINQRTFTSTTTHGTYTFDRWLAGAIDGTSTFTAAAFTVGAAPVAGYESVNFITMQSTGQTLTSARTVLQQRIEDVRVLANQTATISFWAKANSGTPSVAANVYQNFGSGGSAEVAVNGNKTAITTSWVRYSIPIVIPSISGKTIGTSSFLNFRLWTSAGADHNAATNSLGIQTTTIDIWGVQVEAGSIATPFQTATGTIQGELAACQRYYWRQTPTTAGGAYGTGQSFSTTGAGAWINLPVQMRTLAASVDTLDLQFLDYVASAAYAVSAVVLGDGRTSNLLHITFTTATMTSGRFGILRNSLTSGYLGVSAEL
jgi:hypothetical protein